ncbi:hypothetical protein T552_03459 [Pneumocystis carinii B80]|uniref:Uncharacterized protein n=1 Tax=Pneumocystis carinii (strain B80) TaxID=1408658 RepID=A0A0W4ZB09_PNEC8|nr:hypothetical protein T552_03459 [Pneumocystis carinii B80]KTW25599.1 hypothetical protein T552_03459 [Pneumocystis carinii B80]
MSAKAIPTIIFPSTHINTIISIIESCEANIQNTLHEILLKIKYLIQSWINYLNKNIFHVNDVQAFYTYVTNALIKKFEIIIPERWGVLTTSAALSLPNLLNISSFSSLNIDDLRNMIIEIIVLLKDSYSYPLKMDALLSLTSDLLFKHVEPKDIYWEQFN